MSRFYSGPDQIRRAEVMRLLIDEYGNECYLCHGEPTPADPLNIDHYWPQSYCKAAGWSEETYNEISNLRPTHESCNRQKSDQLPVEGWVFTPPAPKLYPTKVVKTPVCETCMNGAFLDVSDQCPDCLLDNSLRRFPKATQKRPKDCSHTFPDHCWYCVTEGIYVSN